MTEYLYHVDENDNVIEKLPRSEIRARNLFHRATAVIVFNSEGHILVHKRTSTKDIFPDYYDTMVGGCVGYGEDYDVAALRETEEEIGVKDAKLEFLFKHRFDDDIGRVIFQVYKLVYDGPIKIQKEEIEFARFMSTDDLKELMKKEMFCPDTIEIFYRYLKESQNKE